MAAVDPLVPKPPPGALIFKLTDGRVLVYTARSVGRLGPDAAPLARMTHDRANELARHAQGLALRALAPSD